MNNAYMTTVFQYIIVAQRNYLMSTWIENTMTWIKLDEAGYYCSTNWSATFTNWDKLCINSFQALSPICFFTLRWTSFQRGIVLAIELLPLEVIVTILVRWSLPGEILMNPCLFKTDSFVIQHRYRYLLAFLVHVLCHCLVFSMFNVFICTYYQ